MIVIMGSLTCCSVSAVCSVASIQWFNTVYSAPSMTECSLQTKSLWAFPWGIDGAFIPGGAGVGACGGSEVRLLLGARPFSLPFPFEGSSFESLPLLFPLPLPCGGSFCFFVSCRTAVRFARESAIVVGNTVALASVFFFCGRNTALFRRLRWQSAGLGISRSVPRERNSPNSSTWICTCCSWGLCCIWRSYLPRGEVFHALCTSNGWMAHRRGVQSQWGPRQRGALAPEG